MTAQVHQLIGEHPSIVALRQMIERVAPSKAGTVLIYGETGTGKGLVARMIHQMSQRAANPFIDINCAAIPAELLESELFGHERGAFTGAVGKKEGLIETANGGSVFLDEVRELDPVMQAKILTVLDGKRFRRVGAVKPINVDVRFIAATNKVLLQEVKAGKFRDDLYYRLQVISINIPPLRERGEDFADPGHRFEFPGTSPGPLMIILETIDVVIKCIDPCGCQISTLAHPSAHDFADPSCISDGLSITDQNGSYRCPETFGKTYGDTIE